MSTDVEVLAILQQLDPARQQELLDCHERISAEQQSAQQRTVATT